jgi:hypothetical protein
MKAILSIIATVLSFLRAVADRLAEQRAKQAGKDESELEARREIDRLNADADDAVGRVQHDHEAIVNDPNNRRRKRPNGS